MLYLYLYLSTTTSRIVFAQGGLKPSQPLKQSITWKYRQLAENQYTADIKKVSVL